MLFAPGKHLCIAFVAMVMAGCGSEANVKLGVVEEQEKEDVTKQLKKQYSAEEIYTQFVECRLSTNKLIAKIGEPDFKGIVEGKTFWQYYDLQTSDDGSRQTFNTNFIIADGVVTYTWVTKMRDAYEDPED